MLDQLCKTHTDLKEADIQKLQSIEQLLPSFCELANADIFIDCFFQNEEKGIVVAHGKPATNSQYQENIQGKIVLPQNEPIVFYTRKTGKSIQDAKAFTQEKKWVLQRTVPIKNDENKIIAVLIEERDMTNNIQTRKKMQEMGKVTEQLSPVPQWGADQEGQQKEDTPPEEREVVDKFMMIQEMHHRIKNNLQIISSILSMQQRRSTCTETKEVLKDNISRINNIASIHEALMTNKGELLNINEQIQRLASGMVNYAVSDEKEITIQVTGDTLLVDSEKALSVLMVVNELITNSIRHGYREKSQGKITINLVKGTVFSTIMVEDDGRGMEQEGPQEMKLQGLGSELIKTIVSDKLGGSIHVNSDSSGTCVIFDFSS